MSKLRKRKPKGGKDGAKKARADKKKKVTSGKGKGKGKKARKPTRGGPSRKSAATRRAAQRVTEMRRDAELARARLRLILSSKFQNPAQNATPSDLEKQICQHLVDLEASSRDLKVYYNTYSILNRKFAHNNIC